MMELFLTIRLFENEMWHFSGLYMKPIRKVKTNRLYYCQIYIVCQHCWSIEMCRNGSQLSVVRLVVVQFFRLLQDVSFRCMPTISSYVSLSQN